eukprot:XP_001706159.1 Hypothetical protein GL50803_32291 [Giardia lamblia ATCC 50803]
MLHDEDRAPRPRVSTPVPRGASSSSRGGHHLFHYQGCAPRAPLSWSHSTHSWMPAEHSHAVVSGEKYGPPIHGSKGALAGGPSPSTRPHRRPSCAVRLAQ